MEFFDLFPILEPQPQVVIEQMASKGGDVTYSFYKYRMESLEEAQRLTAVLLQYAATNSLSAPVIVFF